MGRRVRSTTVADVLTAAAFVPSSPLIVPETNGLSSSGTDALRTAVLEAAGALSETAEWLVVGVDDTGGVVSSDVRGTFAGFGVDVVVSLGPAATGDADPMLPLPALIAGWLREQVCPYAVAETNLVGRDADSADCEAAGKSLRERMDADDVPRGLLVVADGAATLDEKAPGAYDPRSVAVEAALAAALAGGDVAELAALEPALCEQIRLDARAAWQVLAGVFAGGPASAAVTYSGAPYGVGYHAGVWTP